MNQVDRLKTLAFFGHSSYASYLREQTDGLDVGESNGVNLFGSTHQNARVSMQQVAKSQGRKYRTLATSDQTMTVVRIQ